jgi:hypothetical protein
MTPLELSEWWSYVTLQIVASLMIIILITLEVSFTLQESSIMLLENIYSTGVTHD